MATEQKVIRKLSAIFSADVKGYSTLMTNDEFTTIKTLKAYRAIMSEKIKEHSGRVVDALGDNMLAEFPSAVEAVLCSMEIQNTLKVKNDTLSDDKRLEFRIGINVGDVVHDDNSLYGEGVNIAARIEGLADPGGICISRGAYDHVRNKLRMGYEYIGEHSVKNIKNPVRVYKITMDSKDAGERIKKGLKLPALNTKIKTFLKATAVLILVLFAVLAGVYWKYFHLPTPVGIDPDAKMEFNLPEGPSIAVLPFVNLSKDPEMEYFCDGMTKNIISNLSQPQSFLVIAHNSTSAYKNKSMNIQQIGHELGAKYVLEGSVQKSNSLFRFLIQLIDTESGLQIWAETYDREFKDIFALQDEITLEILKAVGIKLAAPWEDTGSMKGVNNIKSYIKAIEVYDYIQNPTKEGFTYALKTTEEIIASNPELPNGYEGLAGVYITGILFESCESVGICYMKASEAVKKSLSLNENSYRAYNSLGWLFLIRKEYDKAITSIKKAISLNPNYAEAYSAMGAVFNYADKPSEALESLKVAIRLDPIPQVGYLFSMGWSYLNLEQYEKAVDIFDRCINRQVDYWPAYSLLAIAYDYLGQEEKAKEAVNKLLHFNPDYTIEKVRQNSLEKNLDRFERSVNALRKAGVPEK